MVWALIVIKGGRPQIIDSGGTGAYVGLQKLIFDCVESIAHMKLGYGILSIIVQVLGGSKFL